MWTLRKNVAVGGNHQKRGRVKCSRCHVFWRCLFDLHLEFERALSWEPRPASYIENINLKNISPTSSDSCILTCYPRDTSACTHSKFPLSHFALHTSSKALLHHKHRRRNGGPILFLSYNILPKVCLSHFKSLLNMYTNSMQWQTCSDRYKTCATEQSI